jgi:beta-mannosidase
MFKFIANIVLFVLFANVAYSQKQTILLDNWSFRNANENKWMQAYIPSYIHLDLLENHLIPDPYYGENENLNTWIDTTIWIYKTSFNISKHQLNNRDVRLVFEGLDTYANVFINGKLLAKTENMFLQYQFSIKELLKLGKNEIVVEFEPALLKADLLYNKLPYKLPSDARAVVRKSPYMFGWDWGLNIPSCGIWKPVKINFYEAPTIKNVQLHQLKLNHAAALMKLDVELDTNYGNEEISFIVKDKSGVAIFDSIYDLSGVANNVVFDIDNPKLWWPNGYGEQYLYTINVNLISQGKHIETKTWRFGLRNISLVQKQDSIGKSFYFEVNRKQIFAKGTNIIPFDHFPSNVDIDKYKYYLQKAKSANMNMVRVWGGGVYESDDFYKLCDEMGLLVWQDFIFAGNMVTGDSTFVTNVKKEVTQQILRLRNHPSLALWCGNNEISEAWNNWGWQKQFNISKEDSTIIIHDYNKLFKNQISSIVDKLDSGRYYHPSSPTTGWGRRESLTQGDIHYWGVWWGMKPLDEYKNHTGRFVSEFGFQGMPSISTLQKYTPDSQLYIGSPILKAHQKHTRGFETIDEYLKRDYDSFKNIEKYIFASQLLQARAMRIAIESQRKQMPVCQGSLVWQLNDTWPVVSWSLIDYERNPKPAYYQIKHSFSPVIFNSTISDSWMLFYAISDLPYSLNGSLEVAFIDFKGKVLSRKTQNVKIDSSSSSILFSLPIEEISDIIKNPNNYFVKFTFKGSRGRLINWINIFAKPKDLHLKPANVNIKYFDNNTIELKCKDDVVLSVFLESDGVEFEDNLLTLIPGQPIRLSYTRINKSNKKEFPIKVQSLNWLLQ